jgi:hypothetical protein
VLVNYTTSCLVIAADFKKHGDGYYLCFAQHCLRGIAAVGAICGPNFISLKVPIFRRSQRFAARFFHQHSKTWASVPTLPELAPPPSGLVIVTSVSALQGNLSKTLVSECRIGEEPFLRSLYDGGHLMNY